ncbi:MAG: methyltransferase domain-containing protein [bacterium]|nr:methyltransferase domain-containing protein [bacterium]
MVYTSKTYALINKKDKRHLKEVLKYLVPRREEKILEVGCGRGFVVRELQNVTPDVYGIDVNPNSIEHGVANNLRVMNAEHLEFDDATFDKLYSFHAIEHIPNIKKALEEMDRVLRPGGRALLVYPAEPIRGLFSIPAATILFKNPLRTREVHLHKLNPKRIQNLLGGTKLEHKESKFSFFSSPQYFTVLQKRLSS